MEPIFLAIETATSACSVALVKGEQVFSRFEVAPKAHTQLILPMVEAVLSEANISLKEVNYLAVGRGPGSFTGVRLAVSVAQGLGFGANLPIYPVSTLKALAYQSYEQNFPTQEKIGVLPLLDARMQEVYVAAFSYENNQLSYWQEERLCTPSLLNPADYPFEKVVVIGEDWSNEAIQKSFVSWPQEITFIKAFPHAKHIALVAQAQYREGRAGIAAEKVLPIYLRDKVAEKSTNPPARIARDPL